MGTRESFNYPVAAPSSLFPMNAMNAMNAMSPMIGPVQQLIPPGLQSLYESCMRIYPEQPNPLQVTAVIKYWLA